MRKSSASGFTLLEMLVAIVVLMMILTLFAQIFSQAGKTTAGESKKIAAFSGAVGAFDRLYTDLSMRVRGDDTLSVSPDGKKLSFYAQVRNDDADSRLSLVTYFTENGALYRRVTPTGWDQSTSAPTHATSGQVLSDEVYGVQFSFIRNDGKLYPTEGPSIDANNGLLVTFACMDRSSRKRLADPEGTLSSLNASQFKAVNSAGAGEGPITKWRTILQLQGGDSGTTIFQNSSFYERRYNLD